MRATHLRNLALAIAAAIGLPAAPALAVPLGSAVSYQGQLNESGQVATGSFDLQFKLFDALTSGLQIGPTVLKNGVSVVDGIFTAELDFGAAAFNDQQRFIEIAVREAGVGTFVTLTPRQKVVAAPVAQFALASDAGGTCECPFSVVGSTLSFTGGSVGIGTTSPESPLHVLEGSAGAVTAHSNSSLVLERSGNNYLNMLTPDANESGVLFGNPGLDSTAGGIIFNASSTLDGLQLRTGGNQTRMTIDDAGNVGINTTAPAEALHVRTPTGIPLTTLLVTPGTSDSDSQIKMTENTSATLGAIMRFDGSSNQWQLIGLTTGGVETNPHVVVNRDNGNMGVGITSPSTRLQVAGIIHSTTGGIRFPDGTTQLSAQVAGPPGPAGPPGAVGATGVPATSMSVCGAATPAAAPNACEAACGGDAMVLVDTTTGSASCTVTSDTGTCTQPPAGGTAVNFCCVCKQP